MHLGALIASANMRVCTLTRPNPSNLLLDITLMIIIKLIMMNLMMNMMNLMNMLMTMLRAISNLSALILNVARPLILIASLMTLRRIFLLGIKAAALG